VRHQCVPAEREVRSTRHGGWDRVDPVDPVDRVDPVYPEERLAAMAAGLRGG